MRSVVNPSTTVYFDNPIQDQAQDLLGRKPFVEGLYKQIEKLPSPDSFVFGLHGSWGEGKTSVLNLLRNRLAQNPLIIPVVFNPWYMATERAIIQNFYDTIEQVLQKRYLVGTLHRHLNRYRDLLSSGIRSVGFGLELPIHDEPERLRQELEDWITRTDCRLVIIVDDIDRLQPAEILAVFKLAGLSARLKNSVFILSFDEVAIRERLKEVSNVDPAFLEKIVQKPIPLPPAEQRDIDRFLLFSDPIGPQAHRSAIDSLLDDLNVDDERRRAFDAEIVYFYQRYLVTIFRTLRHVKRYLNSLRTTLSAIIDEVNLYDFFLLEVLQVFFPEVYQDIWRHRWFYIAEGILQPGPLTPLIDRQEKDRLICEHLDTLLKNTRNQEVVRILLAEIFLEVAQAFKNRKVMYSGRSAYGRQEKRLTEPGCFPKYFLLRVPAKEIPDSAVESLIRRWNGLPVEEVGKKIKEDFEYYQQAEMLSEFFRKLALFKQNISPEHVPTLIRVLYKDASNFLRYTERRLSLSVGADTLMWALLLESKIQEKARSLLEEIICEAESIPFIVGAALDCQRGSADSFLPNNDRPVIRRLAAARLYKYFVEEKRDILIELPDDWGSVLYQWGTDWMTQESENRDVVQSYMLGIIDRKPEYLGRLFLKFDREGNSLNEANFHWDEFIRIYDPNVFAERLTRYGDRAFSKPEEREAAQRFLQIYNRNQGTEAQTQEGPS